MIYVIYNSSTKSIKIGYSSDPKARLRELQTGNEIRLELVYSTAGTLQQEKTIHKQLKEYKLLGEWYNYFKVKHLLPNLIPGWLDVEMDYTQLYSNVFPFILELNDKWAVRYLHWIIPQCNSSNMVPHSPKAISDFQEELRKRGKQPPSEKTIRDAMTELVKFKLLIKHSNNAYQLNPLILWADDVNKRIEELKEAGKYDSFELEEAQVIPVIDKPKKPTNVSIGKAKKQKLLEEESEFTLLNEPEE